MSMIPIQNRLRIRSAPIDLALQQFKKELRCSMPAIVTAFDSTRQVVSVQPAIAERLRKNSAPVTIQLPVLQDVPIAFPTGGGWSLTLPIEVGDECDLIFQDMGIDLWWQNGGVANQMDGALFRHAIGDAVAWFGLRSQPRRLEDYSTSSMQLRSDDGSVVIDLSLAKVQIIAPFVQALNAGTPLPVMSQPFLTWFVAEVMPFLVAHGYTGTVPPATSITTVLEAE